MGDWTVDGNLSENGKRVFYSSGTVSSTGWYNILRFRAGADATLKGNRVYTIDITLHRTYSNTSNECHRITLLGCYNNFRFVDESSISNTQYLKQIRWCYDANTLYGYLQVYYDASVSNPCDSICVVYADSVIQDKFDAMQWTANVSTKTSFATYIINATGAGLLTINNGITGMHTSGGTLAEQKANLIVPVERLSFSGHGSAASDYCQEWVKYICSAYPGYTRGVFIGPALGNTSGYIQCLIYDTSVVNSSGLPQYSCGHLVWYTSNAADMYLFGTTSYTFKTRLVTATNV